MSQIPSGKPLYCELREERNWCKNSQSSHPHNFVMTSLTYSLNMTKTRATPTHTESATLSSITRDCGWSKFGTTPGGTLLSTGRSILARTHRVSISPGGGKRWPTKDDMLFSGQGLILGLRSMPLMLDYPHEACRKEGTASELANEKTRHSAAHFHFLLFYYLLSPSVPHWRVYLPSNVWSTNTYS